MAIGVKLPTVLRPLAGGAERVEVEGATVGEVFAALDPPLRRRRRLMPDVLLLTGSPGSGKTTVAALVATDAARPTVHVTTDQFYRAIRTGFVPPYLPESHRQNEVVVDAIVAAVTAYARGGYDVVVD